MEKLNADTPCVFLVLRHNTTQPLRGSTDFIQTITFSLGAQKKSWICATEILVCQEHERCVWHEWQIVKVIDPFLTSPTSSPGLGSQHPIIPSAPGSVN